MKYNFCTYFDSNYLIKGLAMYLSLVEKCHNFNLYFFAFDDESEKILNLLNLPSITVISQKDFENEELLKVKPGRTKAEYFWTCTPAIIKYAIEKFNLEECTYLDADLFFFDSPQILLEEIGKSSILITAHRYTPEHDKSELLGKYCVQFNTFRNDDKGMEALNWWYKACLDWCYIKVEDGKFGDQKYLDDWPVRFKGVHELKHLGGGVGPWNDSQYEFFKKDRKIWGRHKKTDEKFPIIFYHFHQSKLYKINGRIKLKSQYLSVNKNKNLFDMVYKEYEKALNDAFRTLEKFDFKPKFENKLDYYFKTIQEITPWWIKRPIKNLIRLGRNKNA